MLSTRPRPVAVALWAAALAGLAAPGLAHAGGLFAGDNGSAAFQRAGAFTAKADDPTAIYYNPAGILKGPRGQFFMGVNILSYSMEYTREGVYEGPAGAAYGGLAYPEVENDSGPEFVPFIAGTYRLSDNLGLALGFFAPHGVGRRDYPTGVNVNGVDAPAPQRYDMYEQTALVAFPSVAVAYRLLPNLDFGARGSWGFGIIDAKNAVWGLTNEAEDPGADALFSIHATDAFVFNLGLGVLYRPVPSVEIGFSYVSPAHVRASGDAQTELGATLAEPLPGQMDFVEPVPDNIAACAPGGTLGNLKGCVNLDLPQTATLSARWIAHDGAVERGDIELSVRWENWAAASDIEVIVDGQDHITGSALERSLIVHGFEDVFAVRLGGQYRFDLGQNALFVRGGASYDTAAASTQWTRVDLDGMERLLLAGGVGLLFGKVRVDLGAAWVYEPSRTVEKVAIADENNPQQYEQPNPVFPLFPPNNQAYHPHNLGEYDSGYLMGSLGVTVGF